MSELARMRELFRSDREPVEVLFCTYGFDARFFEGEILPAVFPNSLSFDRGGGSIAAYLHSADELLARRPVNVFFDHLDDEGPELNYGARRVDVGNRAFHPKLIVLDYGDEIRVAIGSANLTRSAWTGLLEIFTVASLVPGEPHTWAGGLHAFLDRLAATVPESEAAAPMVPALRDVPAKDGRSRVMSSWEGSLLEALLDGFGAATRIESVSPFFEGADGEGVFDRLRREFASVEGRLHTGTTEKDGRVQVSGPPAKLRELIERDGWELLAVADAWEGDEQVAPPRALHGKLLALQRGDRTRLMTGSANLTRAALLGRAPGFNVELVVIEDCGPEQLARALPQSRPLDPAAVDIVERGDPTGEDDEPAHGPERHVAAATYRVEDGLLELELRPGAPALTVRYDEAELPLARAGDTLRGPLALALPRYVVVDDGAGRGAVPFVIVGLGALEPRGRGASLGLLEFLEVLAGEREVASPSDGIERVAAEATGPGGVPTLVEGAIPWRRILAAVAGLGRELQRDLEVPRGLEFTLDNPSRLAGLVARLEDAHASDPRRFAAADLVYALYEVERELRRVAGLDAPPDSARLIAAAVAEVGSRRRRLEANVGPKVVDQLATLAASDR